MWALGRQSLLFAAAGWTHWRSTRLSPAATGLIVTLTQIGYGLGLLLIVPLADIIENRRLLVSTIMLSCLGLVAAATSANYVAFLASSLVIGLGSVTAQIIVPYASYMAPEATRGRVVGNVMSGLMFGIMLARPVSSFLAEFFSWHVVFVLSAIAMAGLALTLRSVLPMRRPTSGLSYGSLLGSMGRLVATTPILRRRSLYQACLFSTFSLFWTTVPLLLAGPVFHLGQAGIGLFALCRCRRSGRRANRRSHCRSRLDPSRFNLCDPECGHCHADYAIYARWIDNVAWAPGHLRQFCSISARPRT